MDTPNVVGLVYQALGMSTSMAKSSLQHLDKDLEMIGKIYEQILPDMEMIKKRIKQTQQAIGQIAEENCEQIEPDMEIIEENMNQTKQALISVLETLEQNHYNTIAAPEKTGTSAP
ncbi:hypothetical protein FHETE_9578 [Fusarium heterosporum]|uniref:Uncharacterized protein n=1 Tax=Fusarium heterosporum TaxID=42747 RepID=A0A8H5SWW4_FUSHE|nr:hypothetical protein FHETE_9578 [Fusarium heterosporum]